MPTFYQAANLLRGLLFGDVARTGPFYVNVDITPRCNLRCLGCRFHSPRVGGKPQAPHSPLDMPLGLFTRLCAELKLMGTRSMIVQGSGEPLLHHRLHEMISKATAEGFRVTLLTNGTLLDKDSISGLMDARLNVLRVSLWATSPEQYRQNYPGNDEDNFRRVVEGLSLVTRLKASRRSPLPRSILYYVVNRFNWQSIDRMVELASEVGCDGLFFAPMQNANQDLTSFMLSEDEQRAALASMVRAARKLKKLSMEHNLAWALLRYKTASPRWRNPACYIPWFHARIMSDGSVRPCGRCDGSVSFGNLHEHSFQEIWNGPAIRAFRRAALTSRGLASVAEHCDCGMCCFMADTLRVHRFFRWLSPFAAARRGPSPRPTIGPRVDV